MATERAERFRRMLEAAGDPRRFAMLLWLRGRRLTVQDVVACTGLAQPLVSHHLAILRGAGLVGVEPEGRRRYHSLALEDPLAAQVLAGIEDFDSSRLPVEVLESRQPVQSPKKKAAPKRRAGSSTSRSEDRAPVAFLSGDGTDAVAGGVESVAAPERSSGESTVAEVPAPAPALEPPPPAAAKQVPEPAPDLEPKSEKSPASPSPPSPTEDIEDFLL